MPGREANRLTRIHRLQLAAVVEEITKQVKQTALRADLNDIDSWWKRTVGGLVALLAMAFKTVRSLTEKYLREHARLEGREVDPVLAEWVTEQVLTSLRVTGPVAFKTAIREGADPVSARVIMSTRLAGSAQRLVLEGERQTVSATVEARGAIIGWRRVGDGDPCAWCAMLISRGAVYLTEASAISVVGRSGRPRAKGKRALGMDYHDWDGCTAEPLYEGEDEPGDVVALQDAWGRVTDGLSGDDALRAWREWWDGGGREDLDLPAEARDKPARPKPLQITPFDPADVIEDDERFLNLDDEPIDLQQQAIDRQARIDALRDRANLLADLEQIAVINEADGDELSRQARQAAQQLADDPMFAGILRHTEAGNAALVEASIETIAERLGLTRIGGELGSLQVVKFDRSKHKPLPREKPGAFAEIARPGYVADLGDEQVVLFKADVLEAQRGPVEAMARPGKANALDAVPVSMLDDGLSNGERDTLRSYKGTGSSNLNQVLRVRRGKPMPKSWNWQAYPGWVRDIDGIMTRSALTADVQVFRGISRGEKVFGDAWKGKLDGAEFVEHGYVSTSADRKVAKGFVKDDGALFVLRAPRGVGAIRLSGKEYESEILLQRGLTIRVFKDSGPGPNRVIEAEIVPAGTAPLDSLTVPQLKALAKANGIKVPAKAKRADILKLLQAPADTPRELAQMTVAELKQLAADRGVKLLSKDRKPDIIAKLSAPAGQPSAVPAAVAHAGELAKDLPKTMRPGVSTALEAQAGIVPNAMMNLKEVIAPPLGHPDAARNDVFAHYVLSKKHIAFNHQWTREDDLHKGVPGKGELDRDIRACRASGFMSRSGADEIGQVCAHEFGHHVAGQFARGMVVKGAWEMFYEAEAVQRLVNALDEAFGAKSKVGSRNFAEHDRQFVEASVIDGYVGFNADIFKREVSEYGSTTFGELLAEIWQEFSTMGADARPGIRAVGEIMRELAEERAKQ